MGITKTKTLRKQFTIFLVKELLFIIVTILSSLILYFSLIAVGWVILPNNAEYVVDKYRKELENPDVDYKQYLPTATEHALFSKENKLLEGDISSKEIAYVRQLEKSTVIGYINYTVLYRGEQRLLIISEVLPKLNSSVLGYPNIEPLLLGLNIIFFLAFTFFQTHRLLKNWRIFILNIDRTVQNIQDKQLDFSLPTLEIKEFNDTFFAISEMRNSLEKSLKIQWQLEEEKVRQLSALAHDLKIPLTIIRGNSDLLKDELKDELSIEIMNDIINAEKDIEKYLEKIMFLVQTKKLEQLNKKLISTKDFADSLKKVIHTFNKDNKIDLIFPLQYEGNLLIDLELVNRAILNVLMNAMEHAKEKVILNLQTTQIGIEITICDDGSGFDEKTLQHATEFLYRGDNSRERNGHFGIGLTFAKEVTMKHEGELVIMNGNHSGAMVLLKIPFVSFEKNLKNN